MEQRTGSLGATTRFIMQQIRPQLGEVVGRAARNAWQPGARDDETKLCIMHGKHAVPAGQILPDSAMTRPHYTSRCDDDKLTHFCVLAPRCPNFIIKSENLNASREREREREGLSSVLRSALVAHSELLTRLATFAAELMWLGLVAAPGHCTTHKPPTKATQTCLHFGTMLLCLSLC